MSTLFRVMQETDCFVFEAYLMEMRGVVLMGNGRSVRPNVKEMLRTVITSAQSKNWTTCDAELCWKNKSDNGEDLSLCSGCQKARYCSQTCQKS